MRWIWCGGSAPFTVSRSRSRHSTPWDCESPGWRPGQTGGSTMASTTPRFGLSSIGQIFVRAKNLDRAVRFYRDTLGMPFLFQVPRMAFFQCGATTVMPGFAETAGLDHAASLPSNLFPDTRPPPPTCRVRGVDFLTQPH